MPWRPLCGKCAPNCRQSGPGLPRLGRRHRQPPGRVDGCRATLEQEQEDQIIRRILSISRVIIESERHWTALDLDARTTVWSLAHQTPSHFIVGYRFPRFFRPQGARKPRRDRGTQPAREAVGRIPRRVLVHPGQCQRERQGPLSPATACDES